MLKPICNICHTELEKFGGLVFSPPIQDYTNNTAEVKKYHVCSSCFWDIVNPLFAGNNDEEDLS
jgi:hypothetical protein